MKKAKEFKFSPDKEVTREEMRAMTTSGSGGTPSPGTGSGSGSGGTNPPPTPDPNPGGSGSGSGLWPFDPMDKGKDERERQKKACEGKKQGSGCSWAGSGGIPESGTCNWEDTTQAYYCSNVAIDGYQSGTGGFSERQAACLNKGEGDECTFRGDAGVTLKGKCTKDIWSLEAKPFRCEGAK